MKKLFIILFVLISNIGMCFDYPSYAENYLETVRGTKINNGVCMDLVKDLFKGVEDSMLIDIDKMVWGSPIDFSQAQTGDIVIYLNHIGVIYINGNTTYIVDQNSTGDSNEVTFRNFNKNLLNINNFQLYRPIELEQVELFHDGFSKRVLMNLYTIHISDEDKMSRCVSNVEYSKYVRQYIVDPTLRYTPSELVFSKYYNGKVLCPNNECYIKTPEGKLDVIKTQYLEWKPKN